MSFQSIADIVQEHAAEASYPADLSFQVSGRYMQQLAVNLQPGYRLVGRASSVIAYDRDVAFEDAGNEQLVMALNTGDGPARLVFSPGGPVGAFDLRRYAGRILLPQESFLAAGPGVRLKPYSHIRSLSSPARPNGLVLLQADGEGWVFTGASGEVSHIRLEAGQTLAVRSCAIAALAATVVIDRAAGPQAHVAEGANNVAVLRGPGGVWLQAAPMAVASAPPAQQLDQLQPTLQLTRPSTAQTNPALQ
jgi:uncharacterized protein (AIM24 family)